MTYLRTLLSTVLVSSFLGGCDTVSSTNSQCIKPVLVPDLSRTPLYPVIEDDPRAATISISQSGCGGSKEELPGENDDIGINMALTIPEARKGTGRVKKVIFPVFVALLDKQENVVDRWDEKIEVTITDQPLNHTHKITYHPPEGINAGSADHRILVGFKGNVLAEHVTKAEHGPVKKSAPAKRRKGNARHKPIEAKETQE